MHRRAEIVEQRDAPRLGRVAGAIRDRQPLHAAPGPAERPPGAHPRPRHQERGLRQVILAEHGVLVREPAELRADHRDRVVREHAVLVLPRVQLRQVLVEEPREVAVHLGLLRFVADVRVPAEHAEVDDHAARQVVLDQPHRAIEALGHHLGHVVGRALRGDQRRDVRDAVVEVRDLAVVRRGLRGGGRAARAAIGRRGLAAEHLRQRVELVGRRARDLLEHVALAEVERVGGAEVARRVHVPALEVQVRDPERLALAMAREDVERRRPAGHDVGLQVKELLLSGLVVHRPDLHAVEHGERGAPARERREVRAEPEVGGRRDVIVLGQRDHAVDVAGHLGIGREQRVVAAREEESGPSRPGAGRARSRGARLDDSPRSPGTPPCPARASRSHVASAPSSRYHARARPDSSTDGIRTSASALRAYTGSCDPRAHERGSRQRRGDPGLEHGAVRQVLARSAASSPTASPSTGCARWTATRRVWGAASSTSAAASATRRSSSRAASVRRAEAVGVDAAARFIDVARGDAAEKRLANAVFEVADVEAAVPGGPYELAFSRMGTMFFARPVAALRAIRRALQPGGWLCMVVWRNREANQCFHLPERIVRELLGHPAKGDQVTCGPGPFSMASADLVSEQLLEARLRADRVRAQRLPDPHRRGSGASGAVLADARAGGRGRAAVRQGGRRARARRS